MIMGDWRRYRSDDARKEVEASQEWKTPSTVCCGRLVAYRMRNKGEYAVHVKSLGLTKDEHRFVKKFRFKGSRAFGFHGGLTFARSGKRGFTRPEMFFVLDGTDMGYKATYVDMLTGKENMVKDAWRDIQIADLTDSAFFTLGELYDQLCKSVAICGEHAI
jgi:hypothetical protein